MDWLQNTWELIYDPIANAVTSAFPWINVILMVIAGCLGSMLFGKIRESVRDVLLRALGLCVILMGFVEMWNGFFVLQTGQFETVGTMLVVVALPAGYAFGHGLSLDVALGRLGNRLFGMFIKDKPARPMPARMPDGTPLSPKKESRSARPSAEGFMLAAVICAFSSTTLYSMWESQMAADALPLLLRLGFHVVVFFLLASLFGGGITFAAIPVLAVELIMLLVSALWGDLLTHTLMSQFRLIGAVILVATGIALGCGKRCRSAKLIPAYMIPIIFGLVKLLSDKLIETA